ncbi:hypothetical protein V2J09_021064 [Rumex salicifolius]
MAANPKHLSSLLLILYIQCLWPSEAATTLNVVRLGARANGRSDSTAAFSKAWGLACKSWWPTTIHVPRGNYVVRPIWFTGPCRSKVSIWMDKRATLLAPSDYSSLQKAGTWIFFYKVNGLSIYGGTINARATAFWACRKRGSCGTGARSLTFMWCSNVEVGSLTSLYSQGVHIAVNHGNKVALKGLNVVAPSTSPNTDGIHIASSTGITVSGSGIHTGDDCISIGPSTSNVRIQGIACGPGHGISIGSLGNTYNEGGVQDITVTSVVFYKTTNGVRIKTWATPTTSLVKNVEFRNIIMRDVYNPIIIDQTYCPYNNCARGQSSGAKISGIKYNNIRGTSKSKVAIMFECSSSNACRGLSLKNIRLTYMRTPAVSKCYNAHGTNSGVVVPRSCL